MKCHLYSFSALSYLTTVSFSKNFHLPAYCQVFAPFRILEPSLFVFSLILTSSFFQQFLVKLQPIFMRKLKFDSIVFSNENSLENICFKVLWCFFISLLWIVNDLFECIRSCRFIFLYFKSIFRV